MLVSFSFRDRTYIDRSFIVLSVRVYVLGPHLYQSATFLSFCVQFELGQHLYRSVIILSIRVCVSGPHPYRSGIFLSFTLCSIWVFRTVLISIGHCFVSLIRGRTYIDRPFSYHFHVRLSWSRTYIDRPSSYHFHVSLSLCFGAAPILINHISIILCLVWIETALISIGHHLVRLSLYFGAAPILISHIPVRLCSVWVEVAPILIGHHLVSSSLCFGAAPISIGHILVSLCLVWVGTAPISINHCFFRLSWVLFASESYLHSWVLFDFESPSFFSFGIQSHRTYPFKHLDVGN